MNSAQETALYTDTSRMKRINDNIQIAAKSGYYQTKMPLKWVNESEIWNLREAGYGIEQDDQSVTISWNPMNMKK